MSVSRGDGESVVDSFRAFFSPLGEVVADGDGVSFRAAETGLSLQRDGTSVSFMPLHELGARWEEIEFDRGQQQVRLIGDGVSYTYRVPPNLIPNA